MAEQGRDETERRFEQWRIYRQRIRLITTLLVSVLLMVAYYFWIRA